MNKRTYETMKKFLAMLDDGGKETEKTERPKIQYI